MKRNRSWTTAQHAPPAARQAAALAPGGSVQIAWTTPQITKETTRSDHGSHFGAEVTPGPSPDSSDVDFRHARDLLGLKTEVVGVVSMGTTGGASGDQVQRQRERPTRAIQTLQSIFQKNLDTALGWTACTRCTNSITAG
jgi:hypothetical protein